MMSLSAPPASIGKRTAPPPTVKLVTRSGALGKKQRRGRAHVWADDVGSSQAPLVDQPGQKPSRGVRGDQFRATIGVTESRQVDGDHPPDGSNAAPDATEGPEAFGPRRQQQHGDV